MGGPDPCGRGVSILSCDHGHGNPVCARPRTENAVWQDSSPNADPVPHRAGLERAGERDGEGGPLRIMGVLQRIALCYGAAALLYCWVDALKLFYIAVILLVIYTGAHTVSVPGFGPPDLMAPGGDIGAYMDRTIFGDHIYRGIVGIYDPEGLLSTIPAIAQTLFGVSFGFLLMMYVVHVRQISSLAPKVLAGLGAVAVGSGWILALEVPIVKALWTGPYVLVTTGVAFILIGGMMEVQDRRGKGQMVASTLDILGRNAILAYVLHTVLLILLKQTLVPWSYDLAAGMVGAKMASIAPVLLIVALTGIPLAILARRKNGSQSDG